MFVKASKSIEYGKAPEQLKVIFVQGDRIGQRLQIHGVGERTQMDYVAKQVLGFLGELGAELSFVAEYSKALKLYTNKRYCTGEGRKSNVEAITGFLISGITVTIDGLVKRGCVRIRLIQNDFIDVPLHANDSIMDLKRKIFQQKKIPVDKQKLKFQGFVLTNDQQAKLSGIEEGDELWVDSQPTSLQIQMPNLVTIKIQAQNDEKIEKICLQACKDAKIRPVQIGLRRNEVIVDISKTIAEIETSGLLQLTVNIPMIEIQLKTKNNKVFDLRVERDGTVKSIKQTLWIKEGIPIEKQILVVASITMEDGRLLQDYNIQQGMTILLQKTPGVMIQIFIKRPKNKAFAVMIDNEESVLELKKKIYDKLNIFINEQRLIFAGKELEDEHDLIEYDIQDHSTVELELRLVGGAPPKKFVNVDGTDSLIKAKYHQSAPDYLFPLPGLTILGECKSTICKAKGKEVLFNAGFTDFDLLLSQAFCPSCKNEITPVTPGFSSCLWRIISKKTDGTVSGQPWKKEGPEHVMFNPLEAGTVDYHRLVIKTREVQQMRQKNGGQLEGDEDQSYNLSQSEAGAIYPIADSCGLCHERQDASDQDGVVLIRCGHSFHLQCIQNWKDRGLTCPHCEGPMEIME